MSPPPLSRIRHLADVLRPAPTLVVVAFFTVFAGFDLAAEQFAPDWKRPPMIGFLTGLGLWQWATLALAALLLLVFEGSYRQARRLTAERDADKAALDAALNARSAQRRAVLDSAEAQTRLSLAAALTRVHRHVVGWEPQPDFPRESLRVAGRLKDHLAHHPEALTFWSEFSSALSAVDVQDRMRQARPITEADVTALFLDGDPARERLTDVVRRFGAWLRQAD